MKTNGRGEGGELARLSLALGPADDPLVRLRLAEAATHGAVGLRLGVPLVRRDALAEVAQKFVEYARIALAHDAREALTEVKDERLGIAHLDLVAVLPSEDPTHLVVGRSRFDPVVRVDDVAEDFVLPQPIVQTELLVHAASLGENVVSFYILAQST